MNTLIDPAVIAMPDVQSGLDKRQIPIQRVGVRGVKYPLILATTGNNQTSIADWEMTVALPADEKGTHMSRFVDLLGQYANQAMTPASFCLMADQMLDKLNVQSGDISAGFTYFMEKTAPVSGVKSLLDFQVRWNVTAQKGQVTNFSLWVQVPVTSLCPCSKAISEYGAHNQRSHVGVKLDYNSTSSINMDELIRTVEAQASCELWGLLKRVDEKYVTEKAYENPKFVEDLVRDVAVAVKQMPGVSSYEITAENFESIHNHSAYAVVYG